MVARLDTGLSSLISLVFSSAPSRLPSDCCLPVAIPPIGQKHILAVSPVGSHSVRMGYEVGDHRHISYSIVSDSMMFMGIPTQSRPYMNENRGGDQP